MKTVIKKQKKRAYKYNNGNFMNFIETTNIHVCLCT